MSPIPAARYTDPIEHTNAMAGFVMGAIAGAAIALTAVAVIGTGGAALGVIAAVGGVLAATGGGAMIGAAIGQMFTSVSGAISATCSTNVMINNLGAARAELDGADCDKHPGKPGPRIATGAATVIINGYPAARKDEALVCGGWISGGSDNVLIGGPSVQLLDINPEIPEWLMTTAEWMTYIGGGMMLGAGGLMALGSRCAMQMALTGLVRGLVLEQVAAGVGGVVGYAIDGERGQAIGEMVGGFLGGFLGGRSSRGHPVDVATGELFAIQTDFILPGPLPLEFTRHWMSASHQTGSSGEMGWKWNHSLDMRLTRPDDLGLFVLRHGDGHIGFFPEPLRGQPSLNLIDREILTRSDGPSGHGYAVTDYDGISHHFLPDPRDRASFLLHRITDANGNAITLYRDGNGHLTGIRDSSGRDLVVTTNRQGWITRIAAPAPEGEGHMALMSYDYSPQGDMIAATDARGHAIRYDYAAHLLIREIRRGGVTYHFRWDDPRLGTRARCLETWGEAPEAEMSTLQYARFDYDPEAPLVRVTDAAGGVVEYEHDSRGKVVRQRDPGGVEVTWSYDISHHETAMRDDAGRGEATEYDQFARITAIKPRHGLTLRRRYGSDDPRSPLFGQVIEETTGEGPEAATERRDYDARGNLIRVTDALGQEQRVLRDARGLPVATSDAMGSRWRWQWDAAGMLVAEGPDRLDRFYTRDRLGRVTMQRDGAQAPTRFDYDPNGNMVAITTGDGRQARMEYDAEDQQIMHRDPSGRVTRTHYAGLSKPVQQVDAEGTTTSFRYDHEMRLLAVRNGNGDIAEHRFNLLGQRVYERNFDGLVWNYRYDRAGYPAEIDGPEGITRARFNPVGQLLACDYAGGARQEFSYDRAGNLTLAVANGQRMTRRYDALMRPIAEDRDGEVIGWDYDCRDNVVATILPGGEVIRHDFRADGARMAVSLDDRQIARWSYGQTGQLRERQQVGSRRSYGWDDDGRPVLDQLSRIPASAATLPETIVARRYGWNADDTLSGSEDSRTGARAYRYDAAKRLIGVDSAAPERMRYDRAQNLTGVAQSLPDPGIAPDAGPGAAGFTASARGDRIYPHQDTRLEYDAAGNVTTITTPDSRLSLSYGDMGMLTASLRESAGLRVSASYRYDAFARRIAKEVVEERLDATGEITSQSATATAYLWDGDMMIAEGPADGDRLARLYFYESDGLTPMAFADRQPDGSRKIHYCNTDLSGQPLEMVDSQGNLVWAAQYTAYGVALADMGTGFHQPLRFPGQYYDPETGLHYNRNRYYMPQFGRYTQPDPIGLQGGLNAYFYPANPTLGIDPFGLDAKEDRLGVIYDDTSTATPKPGVRTTGIDRAWRLEADLVRAYEADQERRGNKPTTFRGTREWTAAEKQELLTRGRVTGYDADHINNVADHDAWKGDPRNIRFLPNRHHPTLGNQHRYEANRGHGGNTRTAKGGQLIDRQAMIDRIRQGWASGCK